MANTAFNLPVATLSYPHLSSPDTAFSEEGKYKARLIFDSDADLTQLENAIKATKGKKKPVLADIIREDDEGRRFVDARSKFKPGCYNKQKIKVSGDEIDEVFYGGCRVKANVTVYGHAFGASVGLSNILFVDDGERIGGGGNPFGEPETDSDGFPE